MIINGSSAKRTVHRDALMQASGLGVHFRVGGVPAKISTTVLAQQMLGTSEADAPSHGATIVSNFIVERYFPTSFKP